MKFFENSSRSIVKTVTYRILIVISTFIITYILTGQLELTLAITIGANVINTLLYFIHERAWNQIRWGKSK